MKTRGTAFISGVLVALLVNALVISALAISRQMTITVDPINIQVDGKVFAPKDVNGNDVPVFAYNGTTYAPLRALAEAYDLTVGYDADTNMATVDKGNSTSSQGSVITPSETSTPTGAEKEPITLGTTQTIKDLEATITSYKFSVYAGDLNGLSEAEDGYKYCVVYLDVKNVGFGTLSIDDYNFSLYYNDDYCYLGTWANYAEFLKAHDTIPALGTLNNVCLCFKVPTEVEDNTNLPLRIELKENKSSAKEIVSWKLR